MELTENVETKVDWWEQKFFLKKKRKKNIERKHIFELNHRFLLKHINNKLLKINLINLKKKTLNFSFPFTINNSISNREIKSL